MTARHEESRPGFFAALFDWSFRSYIITRVVPVLYVIGVVGAGIAAIALAVGTLAGTGQPSAVGVIIAPIGFIVFVIYLRVVLETVLVLFRISEHAESLDSKVSG